MAKQLWFDEFLGYSYVEFGDAGSDFAVRGAHYPDTRQGRRECGTGGQRPDGKLKTASAPVGYPDGAQQMQLPVR